MTATTTQIKARLRALLALVPGMSDEPDITEFDDPNATIPPDSLPGYVLYRPRRAGHRYTAAHEKSSTRRWLALLVCAEVQDDSPTSKQDGIEACEDFLDNAIVYLAARPQLQLTGTDNGLPGVLGIALIDNGIGETLERGGKRYASIPLPIDIKTIRSV